MASNNTILPTSPRVIITTGILTLLSGAMLFVTARSVPHVLPQPIDLVWEVVGVAGIVGGIIIVGLVLQELMGSPARNRSKTSRK